MIELTINGVTYDFPETGDELWGDDVLAWASAVNAGMLQKAGGTFTLLADVDFGANYGLKALYYKSRTANLADAGQIRLAAVDSIQWRNAANDDNLSLHIDSDDLYFGDTNISGAVSASWSTGGTGLTPAVGGTNVDIASGDLLTDDIIESTADAGVTIDGVLIKDGAVDGVDVSGVMTNPMTTIGDIITADTDGVAQRLAAGDEDQVLTIVSGEPAWAAAAAGDIAGPGSSTDNTLPRWDGAGGDTLQGSGVTVDDSNNISGVGNITLSGTVDGVDLAAHAADSTIHFTEASIDHTAISNIGTNSHADIDTHLASTSNPHSVDATDVGLGNVTNDAQIAKSIGTAKGDIIGFSASGTPAALPVGTNDQVLTADSTAASGLKWADASGGGITGPGSSTDNAIARWDGTGGDTLQNSGAVVDDSGNVVPATTSAASLGEVSTPKEWAYVRASCTRGVDDGGLSVRNITDDKYATLRFSAAARLYLGGTVTEIDLPGPISNGNFTPKANGVYSCGSSSLNWEEIFLDEGATNGGTVWFNAGGSSIASTADGLTLGLTTFTTLDAATAELKIKLYSQDAEPTLLADANLALWTDTNDSNRTYLIFRRGTGDQIKVELT